MSSSSKSGLQRSRSSSSISQPFRLSRLPVRNSTQKNRGKSLSRPDKLSLDRNMTRSSSNLDIPRLSRQRSGSLVRQTLVTPLGSKSCRKSPLMSSIRKDVRPISDKRWQYEQTVKVRNFVAAKICYLDHNNIKSGIPLELFVALMDSYFKLIDKRITITRENYIEEVPTNLKRFHYPASVKPSLMKTVNTPHSWPHVIAIMSWLTDIINEINGPVKATSELESLAGAGVMESYLQWSKNQDDSAEVEFPLDDLDLKFNTVLKTNDEKMNILDKELEKIVAETEAYTQKKINKMRNMEVLQTNIKSINEKCDFYTAENEKFVTDMKEQHTKTAMTLKKMDQELTASLKTEDELQAGVASQPYTLVEKQQLTQEIKGLQNTLELKQDRCKHQREDVTTYDFQLSDIKQQMEANAYQHNNVVHQLKLINPDFKEVLIRESGFARRDTEDEIEKALRLLREAKVHLEQKLDVFNKKLEELTQKQKQIDQKLVTAKNQEENLSKLEAELTITHAHKIKKDKLEREKALAEINKHQNKLLNLKNSKYDITSLQKELLQLYSNKQKHLAFKQDLVERARYFFGNLEGRMSHNLQIHMDVMEELTGTFMSVQEIAIAISRARIKNLKEARKEVEDNEE